MQNQLHDMKKDFLILGFTGPLRSGCTTSARFFENGINQYIQKSLDKALPRIEKNIRLRLRQLKSLRSASAASIEKREISDQMDHESFLLKENLKIRETLSILNKYKNNSFRYISMTEILVKLAIENLINISDKNLNEDFKKIKNLIDYPLDKFSIISEMNEKIIRRDLVDISSQEMDLYEGFIHYASEFLSKLKRSFDENRFGELLQDLGDNARRCSNPIDYTTPFTKENARSLFILADQANNLIKFFKNKKREKYGLPVFREFVIEALRNPYEVEYFRNRYYEFYLFSILSPLNIRANRAGYRSDRDERDQGQSLRSNEFFKQNVSKCVHLSDIAINNDSQKLHELHRKLAKFFALIRRPGCIAPTDDEAFMQQAHSMSVRSNCISRQVGAVIVGHRNYIIGAGWNDVGSGQIPCGMRRYSDVVDPDVPYPIATKNDVTAFSAFLQDSGRNNLIHSFCF